MSAPRQSNSPDWKHFLNLGQELLKLDTASQIALIQSTVKTELAAQAEIWLASPYYPLPGEDSRFVLPNPAAPDLVSFCINRCSPGNCSGQEFQFPIDCDSPTRIAFPLCTQEHMMGVIYVEVENESSLSTKDLDFIRSLAAQAALSMQVTRQATINNYLYEQLNFIANINSQLSTKIDVMNLSKEIIEIIQSNFKFPYVSLYTINNHPLSIELQANFLSTPEISYSIRDYSKEYTEEIFELIKNSKDPILNPFQSNNETLIPSHSEIVLPLIIGEEKLSFLDILTDPGYVLHDFDRLILSALANNISKALGGVIQQNQLEKRANQISAVLELSYSLTSILSLEPLMEEIVNAIKRNFGFPYVHIFFVHPGRRKIFYEAGSGARSRAFEEHQITYDLDDPFGIIPWVARNGKTLLANDVSQEPLYRPSPLPPENTHAELAIPLAFAGQVHAVLDLQSEQTNSFSPQDIPLLEALCSSIAIAIRNSRLYQSEVWRRQVADSFREIASLVSANTAIEDLLEKILSELERHLPCDAAAIWLLETNFNGDENSSSLSLAASHGLSPADIQRAMESDAAVRDFIGSAIDQNEPSIRPPGGQYGPLGLAGGFPPDYSSIAVPLRAGDTALGVLSLAHKTTGRYGSEAGLIASTFASNAAVAIENNKLFNSSQEQAWISTILLQVAETTQSQITSSELLESMARLIPLLVGVKKVAIFSYDETNQIFSLKTNYGFDKIEEGKLIIPQSFSAAKELISSQTFIFLNDPGEEFNLPLAPSENGEVLLLLPLSARGHVLGSILLTLHRTGDTFLDQQMVALLMGMAQQTSVALENLQLTEARQEEAYVTAVLLQVAQVVVSQNDLEDIFDTIVHLMPILVGIDTCAIYLFDSEANCFRPEKVFAVSHPDEDLIESRDVLQGQFPLLDQVLSSKQLVASPLPSKDVSVSEWTGITQFLSEEEIHRSQITHKDWLLGVPLTDRGEIVGVLVAQESNVSISLHQRRLEIITGIAQQVSLAIQNDRASQETVQRERLEQEIMLARQIQKTFLPSSLPELEGWDIEIQWETAREVGGDFYDVFKIGKDQLGIVIADVSDKGMPAALYMTVTRTLIRAFIQTTSSPGRLLERVNRLLVVDSQDGLFVTAVYAILNLIDGTLTYSIAGHTLPLQVQASDRNVHRLEKGGMPLGVLSTTHYPDRQIQLDDGDMLIFYTDGITESFSPEGEPFGEDRLIQAITSTSSSNLTTLKEKINQTLREFRQGAPPSDDLTTVLVQRKPLLAD